MNNKNLKSLIEEYEVLSEQIRELTKRRHLVAKAIEALRETQAPPEKRVECVNTTLCNVPDNRMFVDQRFLDWLDEQAAKKGVDVMQKEQVVEAIRRRVRRNEQDYFVRNYLCYLARKSGSYGSVAEGSAW